LPALLAHIDGLSNLCYFVPESVLLDRYRPDDAIQQCIEAAIDVLNRVTSGKSQEGEIANEFAAYWALGQQPVAFPVLVDERPTEASCAQYFLIKEDGKPARGLIARDVLTARKFVEKIDIEEVAKGSCTCLYFSTTVAPGVGEKALPTTIHEFFEWLRQWDQALYRRIQERLGATADYLARAGALATRRHRSATDNFCTAPAVPFQSSD
jgi:hypothetical protein